MRDMLLKVNDNMARIDVLKEKLDNFYQSEYAHMTVRELLTSTSNLALPTMVQAKAILVLKSFVDMREYVNQKTVPKGAGKTVKTQILSQPGYDDWTEGSALSAEDPTVSAISLTLSSFGKVTKISDLLANTSAIDFIEEIGRVHGGCVRQGILDKIVDAMASATTNSVSVGTKGDGTEADFSFTHVKDAIGNILNSGFTPEYIITSPDKLWTCFTTDFDVKQFYGALSDLLVSGTIPNVLGLKWLTDPYFELAINAGSAWDGTDGEKYAIVFTKDYSCVWGALQQDPVVEIYRIGTELSNYIVTHMDGGAAKAVDGSICLIKHAA